MKEVDLLPHEWTSEREKPHEPLLGEGAPGWGMWLLGFTLSMSVAYWIRTW